MKYVRNKGIPNNIAFIANPKYKNPFTGKFSTDYFVPAVKNQIPLSYSDNNAIIVCCSPTWNGAWEYDKKLVSTFKTWMNGKTECYYVPIECCTKVRDLDEITAPITRNEIINLQEAWYKGEVKNHPEYKNKRPDWMLKK